MHAGHIHLFKKAKEYGDYLVAVVSRDKNAEKVKGFIPFHNEQERLAYLENIKIIDEVRLGCTDEVYQVIREVKPDIIVLGYDQKIYVDNLEDAITDAGMSIQIVRLAPYQSERYKSARLRKYIERTV